MIVFRPKRGFICIDIQCPSTLSTIRLNELNNQLQRLHSKEVRYELEKYRKLLLERDELREKNKALEQVAKQYDGLKRFFTSELNEKEEGRE